MWCGFIFISTISPWLPGDYERCINIVISYHLFSVYPHTQILISMAENETDYQIPARTGMAFGIVE
jgi:hypothetical protein